MTLTCPTLACPFPKKHVASLSESCVICVFPWFSNVVPVFPGLVLEWSQLSQPNVSLRLCFANGEFPSWESAVFNRNYQPQRSLCVNWLSSRTKQNGATGWVHPSSEKQQLHEDIWDLGVIFWSKKITSTPTPIPQDLTLQKTNISHLGKFGKSS